MRVLCCLLLAAAVPAAAQSYPRPPRAITADLVGPLLFGLGIGYEAPVREGLTARTTVGVREASIFGGGGDLAVSVSGVAIGGARWVAVEGGLGATAWVEETRVGAAPHATVALRLYLPLGESVDGERVVERDLLFRVGAALIYDPTLRSYDDIRLFGAPVYAVPSFGVGAAF